MADRSKIKADLSNVTIDDVEDMLGWAPLLMAHEEHPTDVPQVRRTLAALVHRVELDPETRAIRVHYRIDLSAQPRKGKKSSWVPFRADRLQVVPGT